MQSVLMVGMLSRVVAVYRVTGCRDIVWAE